MPQASQSPAHVVVAGRNPSRLQASIDALRARFPDVDYRPLQMDLSSQKSVRAAAAELLAWRDVPQVDMLVNSAGVMCVPERTLTEDGIELHFATNHIGHFLFTNLVMPKLVKAAESTKTKGATRVINVSSLSPMGSAMRWSDLPRFDKTNRDLPAAEQPNYAMLRQWGVTDAEDRSYVPVEGYNQSKVANVLFSVGASRRLYDKYGILSLSLHPGVIQTELGRDFPPEMMETISSFVGQGLFTFKTLGGGAATSLVAALDPKLGKPETKDGKENHGVFLKDCQIEDALNPPAVSSAEADRLWELSEELVKEKFSW